MLSKLLLGGAAALLFAFNAHAATDAPSGYTKCVQNTGATCSFTGTRSVALGKSGSFVYGTFTTSVVCSSSNFPANSFTTSAWCSYAGTTTSSSSSVAPPSSSSSSVAPPSSSSSQSSAISSIISSSSSSSVATTSSSSAASVSADPYVTGCGTETSNLTASKVYYVTPTGSASGAGTSFSSPMSLNAALSAVGAGQMILLQPGTYTVPYSGSANTITLSKSGTSSAKIYMVAANCGKAVIDFSFPTNTWIQDSYGFSLKGSYWYFKGLEIIHAGYQGVYVFGAHNTFENVAFHDNRNSGLEINQGGSYTNVINCDSYHNYDPKKHGSMADGFASKQTQGPGNFFHGVRTWENSDDGFDSFDSAEPVVIEQSWAFRNGINLWGDTAYAGNGNGFKLGGNGKIEHNKISQSVSWGNVHKGFDQNNNAGGVTLLNNIGYKNDINFGFGGSVSSGEQHTLRNNISLSGTSADSIANAISTNNTWNSLAASSSDFASLDTSLATAARNADGSLPTTSLFRLSSSSKMIDKGVNVGLPYKGTAPDLGAFELK